MSDIHTQAGDAEATKDGKGHEGDGVEAGATEKLRADGTLPYKGEYPAAAKPGNSRLVPSGPEGGTDAGTHPPQGQPGDNPVGP